ncbi:DUF998 domain-containing protein [Prauserella oleivorans]|uniref:DUF998 domain-containing protein n=1 Tax=Prauserella oleivorans TaxID=1478153 RepID=A0ABW5WCV8_9PSEU
MLPDLRRPPTLFGVRLASVGLLSAGTLGQLAWTLEFFLDTGLSPVHAATVDLAASDQPYTSVFRTAEILTGVAFVLAVPPLLRLAPVHRAARSTVVAVGVLGLLCVAKGAFPLDCAVSASEACRERAGYSTGHVVNLVVSLLFGLLYVVGPMTVLLWWHGRWRVIPVLSVLVNTVALGGLVLAGWLGPGHFAGLAARGQLLAGTALLSCGVAYLVSITRDIRPRPRDPVS